MSDREKPFGFEIVEKTSIDWSKRCINCDAYGYKTAKDYKYGRKYCFTHKVYINKPNEIVCKNWLPMD